MNFKKFAGLITLAALLCSVLFISCGKDKINNNSLQTYADQTKIYPLKVYAQHAILSFVVSFNEKNITSRIQIKKASENEWRDIIYTDRNNIPVDGLSTQTAYEIRVELSLASEKKYSAITTFTTEAYDINYAKFFAGFPGLYDKANGIFAMEGSQYVIYGSGFSNVTAIPIVLIKADDTNNKLRLNATIINDSMLSFDIPKNLVGNDPYVNTLIYNCMVGNVPLVGFTSYNSNNYKVMGDLIVVNRDIQITKFSIAASSCPIFTFEGSFGTHKTKGICPPYLYGVSMWTQDRKLIIRSAGSIVKEFSFNEGGAAVCEGVGLAGLDPNVLRKTILSYHEVTALVLRTKLAAGSYTAQVKQTTQDGSVYISNEFPFSF